MTNETEQILSNRWTHSLYYK